MIELIDFSGKKILVNCDLIKKVEQTPDTVIHFLDGTFIVVKDSFYDIQSKVTEFKARTQGHQLCN